MDRNGLINQHIWERKLTEKKLDYLIVEQVNVMSKSVIVAVIIHSSQKKE